MGLQRPLAHVRSARDNWLYRASNPSPGAWCHQSNLIRLAPPAGSGGQPANMVDAGQKSAIPKLGSRSPVRYTGEHLPDAGFGAGRRGFGPRIQTVLVRAPYAPIE